MTATKLTLVAGLDRTLAWREGKSVRYLVADLTAEGPPAALPDAPALNLALAIDVSGSMRGEKLAAAQRTAIAVAEALGPQDRLSVVSFGSAVEVLLAARGMDAAGREVAVASIRRLHIDGMTNLSGGWLQAAEQVALAQLADQAGTHRILLLSDGQANEGITDRAELARHAGELLARGLITSCVGIGDGYDEDLLSGMAEAGGGRLHDAAEASEIDEVVLGELREGRATLVERATLRLTVPATLRAEVVGAWSHTALPGAIEVMVGSLLPDRAKRVVFRLHCPEGEAGSAFLLGLAANGALPDANGLAEAEPMEVQLRLASGSENNAQPRDLDRSLAVLRAWQTDVLRRMVAMNRDGDHRSATQFLQRQLGYMEPYGRGLPGAEPILAELVMVLRHADETWSERTRKGVFAMSTQLSRGEDDLRAAAPQAMREHFEPRGRR